MASKEAKMLPWMPFLAMEPVSAAPAGGSASRSRASKGKGLPAGLSGAGMEKLRLSNSTAQPPHPSVCRLDPAGKQALEAATATHSRAGYCTLSHPRSGSLYKLMHAGFACG
jgi:hypothetical protein